VLGPQVVELLGQHLELMINRNFFLLERLLQSIIRVSHFPLNR
jgi:hypothetical protein